MKRTSFIFCLAIISLFLLVGCSAQVSATEDTPTQSFKAVFTPTWTIEKTPTIQPTATVVLPSINPLAEILDISSKFVFIADTPGLGEIFFLDFSCVGTYKDCHFLQPEKLPLFPAENNQPRISPDGSKIVYLSDYSAEYYIYDVLIYNLEDGTTHRITKTKSFEWDPVWSPDGDKLAYVSRPNGSSHIFIIGSSGCCSQQIPDARKYNSSPSWSPDGEYLAFFAYDIYTSLFSTLFIYEIESGSIIQLTLEDGVWGTYFPRWSPDGNKIAFQVLRNENADVCIVNISTLKQTCITESLLEEVEPYWSPDGKEIAYLTRDGSGNTSIMIMDKDGKNKRTITTVSEGVVNTLMWSPDGKFLVFSSNKTGTWQTYLADPDGDWILQLTDTEFSIYFIDVWTP